MNYDDLFTKGFIRLEEKEAIDLIQLDQFTLLNTEERNRDNGKLDVPSNLSKRLETFAFYLKEKYIDSYWERSTYNKFIVWNGVDRDNQGWHTDTFEGYDYFFLYYFDDTREETGGAIEFKWKDGNDFQTESYQPKRGDLFLVSNKRGYWHRAVASDIQRRVASFDFNTDIQ